MLRLLKAGRGSGYVLWPHSIGPDIRAGTMLCVLAFLEECSEYPLPPKRDCQAVRTDNGKRT